ncbi:hypothetical protein A4U49_08665 [Acidithiobacillus ferrivorans]|nr:hypothetical protein A4U49_08665 [Acidithiobacillus ferrivorans]
MNPYQKVNELFLHAFGHVKQYLSYIIERGEDRMPSFDIGTAPCWGLFQARYVVDGHFGCPSRP